jgi:hypothetical protein
MRVTSWDFSNRPTPVIVGEKNDLHKVEKTKLILTKILSTSGWSLSINWLVHQHHDGLLEPKGIH